jgi:hypothetical protein
MATVSAPSRTLEWVSSSLRYSVEVNNINLGTLYPSLRSDLWLQEPHVDAQDLGSDVSTSFWCKAVVNSGRSLYLWIPPRV